VGRKAWKVCWPRGDEGALYCQAKGLGTATGKWEPLRILNKGVTWLLPVMTLFLQQKEKT
jgi:hypothetical protein